MPKLSDSFPVTPLKLNISKVTMQVTHVFSLAQDEAHRAVTDPDARGRLMITNMIRSWDLTDDGGTQLPVTTETVAMLPELDCQQMTAWLVKRVNAERARIGNGNGQQKAQEPPAPEPVNGEPSETSEEPQPSETVAAE